MPVLAPIAGWHIRVPPQWTLFGGITHILVVIDPLFPSSDPRVVATQAPPDFSWPHVEAGGLLCLPALRRSASPSDRVLKAIEYTFELGAYDADERKREFTREFKAYWDHKKSPSSPLFWTLVPVDGNPAVVWYYNDRDSHRYIFCDSKDRLREWLRNAGKNPDDKQFFSVPLATFEDPPTPSEFPKLGSDVLNAALGTELRKYVTPGEPFPILLRVRTETGVVFAGVILQSPSQKDLLKGFRTIRHVPWDRVLMAVAARPVLRCRADRIDAPWIHGRDHNDELHLLVEKRIALVGCGAIGASVARLLVQAGVQRLDLIDDDLLMASNTSRHALGQEHVGKKKVDKTASMLQRDFPHIHPIRTHDCKIQNLGGAELHKLAQYDLIISAGIDFLGDAYIDRWRRSLENPPPHLATWTEEFALAAHAALLIDKHYLLDYFDDNGHPSFVATTWGTTSTVRLEAGCGNAFQPHGAVDLVNAVSLASRLALDCLLGISQASCRRVWLGSRERVLALGGTPTEQFVDSNLVQEAKL